LEALMLSQLWRRGSLVLVLALCLNPSLVAAQTYRVITGVGGFAQIDPNTNKPSATLSIAPMGSRFNIIDDRSDNGTSIDVIFTYVSETNQRVANAQFAHAKGLTAADSAAFVNKGTPVVTADGKPRYRIAKNILQTALYELAWGKDAGVLAVPFKYQLSGNKLTAGGTLGAYIGYRIKSVTPLLSAGIAFVSTASPTVTPGTQPTTTDTKVGFSVAGGGVVDWLGPVQIGLLAGVDLGIDKDQYAYANKLWLSFSIGTGFTKH
jgi:hypothetical protein